MTVKNTFALVHLKTFCFVSLLNKHNKKKCTLTWLRNSFQLWKWCYTASVIQFPHITVFSIWKSLWVSQKDCIKIVVCAIYTYLHSPLWLEKKKNCDHFFPQQIRPQTTVQWYILQDYSSVRIGFSILVWGLVSVCLTNATHCLKYRPC